MCLVSDILRSPVCLVAVSLPLHTVSVTFFIFEDIMAFSKGEHAYLRVLRLLDRRLRDIVVLSAPVEPQLFDRAFLYGLYTIDVIT